MGCYDHLADVPLSFVTPVSRLLPRKMEHPEHVVVTRIVDPFVVLVRSRETSENNHHKLDPRIKLVERADTAPPRIEIVDHADTAPRSLQRAIDTNYEEMVRDSPGQSEAHEHECEMGHNFFSRIS